jgi:D-serine deaminase-like pyridoxal phosphate-dependent protein
VPTPSNPIDPATFTSTLATLAAEPMDWRFKGIPATWWGRTAADLVAAHAAPFDDGAVGPVCVLSDSALRHNASEMAAWCAERGVDIAPHGKTHMSPQLLARQFDAGAWAVTAATIAQVRVFRAFGVRRIILANELVDAAGLRWLAAELDADPEFELVCWVDSVAGIDAMTAALRDAWRPVDVCVEIGMAGGRTGARTVDTVDEVAGAAAASDRLRLVGVAGYEAATSHDVSPESVATVRAYLRETRAAAERLDGLFERDEVLVTAGGSTYPDLVADELGGWSRPDVRTVLRSGCYLTHDDGQYAATSPLSLRAALTVWAQVMSRPDPDLALFTMGRRDVSHDAGLPLPRGLADAAVTALNDQHAFLRPAGALAIGDWVEFGISHPCTTFDKWQLIPVLDDQRRVVEIARTFF